MKKSIIIFSVLLIFPYSLLTAQYTLQSSTNRPRPGDKLIKQEVLIKDPGRPGNNVLWDFSQLTAVKNSRSVPTQSIDIRQVKGDLSKYFKKETDNSSPVHYFEEDSGRIASGSDHGTIYHYNNSGDSLLLYGYEFPTTKIENHLPEIWLSYPFGFKDKTLSYYAGTGTYCDRLAINLIGCLETEADAYGMMILPNKDTLTNVLRVRTLKTGTDERTPFTVKKNEKQPLAKTDSIAQALKKSKNLVKTEIIRWYAEGYRYPVFEMWHHYQDKEGKRTEETRQAYFYHPLDQEDQYLTNDPENKLIVDNNKNKQKEKENKTELRSEPTAPTLEPTGFRYNLYPNPVERELHVELYLPETTTIKLTLYSLQGIQQYQSPPAKTSGTHTHTIPFHTLPKGEYILQITCGKKTIPEKIIKH